MFCLYGNATTGKITSPAQQRSAAAILMNMLLEGDVAAAAMATPTVESLASVLGKGAEADDQAATGGPAQQPSGAHHAECFTTWCTPSSAASLALPPSICLAVMLSRLARQPSAVQRMLACGALPRLQNVLVAQLIRQTGQRQDLLVDPHCVQARPLVAAEIKCLALSASCWSFMQWAASPVQCL